MSEKCCRYCFASCRYCVATTYPVLPNSSGDKITSQKPQLCTGAITRGIIIWRTCGNNSRKIFRRNDSWYKRVLAFQSTIGLSLFINDSKSFSKWQLWSHNKCQEDIFHKEDKSVYGRTQLDQCFKNLWGFICIHIFLSFIGYDCH